MVEKTSFFYGHSMPDFPFPPRDAATLQALVLIAEDEPEIAEILQAYLGRAGLRGVCG